MKEFQQDCCLLVGCRGVDDHGTNLGEEEEDIVLADWGRCSKVGGISSAEALLLE